MSSYQKCATHYKALIHMMWVLATVNLLLRHVHVVAHKLAHLV